ncbi:MAG: hypothetical protein ABJI96_03195 [Paracoccaceae bacterium]
MSKLILHIGMHKTASTSIQDTFAKNQAYLNQHGLVYPRLGRGHHGLVTTWISLPDHYSLNAPAENHWRHIAKTQGPTNNTVLISTEEMSRGSIGSRVDFMTILNWTKAFDEIEIVCLVRDQLSLLQSIYFQVLPACPNLMWPHFLDQALSSNFATGVFLDYNDLLDFLLKNFQQRNIHFIPFRAAVKHPHGPAGALLDKIDFGSLATGMKFVNSNISEPPLPYWVASMISRPGRPSAADIALAQKMLSDRYGTAKSTIYSPAEAKRVTEKYAKPNSRFCGRVGSVPAATLTGGPAKAGLTFRNELDHSFWLEFIRARDASTFPTRRPA